MKTPNPQVLLGALKLWYLPWLNADQSEFWCYAVSRDGYHWEKPELGRFEFEGSKKNNILTAFRTGSYYNVSKDPYDADPARRYKALGEQEPNDGTRYSRR